MRARITVLLAVLLILALFLSACGEATTPAPEPTAPPEAEPTAPQAPPPTTEAAPEPTAEVPQIDRGGVLRIGAVNEFGDLDPAMVYYFGDTLPYEMVYEGLTRWDPDTLEPLPLLARSWEVSEDGLTYTFHLQEGVKWQNGEDFVADDVKYSVERIQNPELASPLANYISCVGSVEVVDDHTVVFHLNSAYSPLLSQLPYVVKIVNPDFVEAAGGHTQTTMMGTGPFMLDEWTPGEVLKLKSNPNYWRMGEDGQPLPYLDGIEVYPMPDDTARVEALLSNAIDFLVSVPDKDVETLETNADVELSPGWSTYWSFVGFSGKIEPFDDPRVRQAISWVIDRDAIAQALYNQVDPLYGGIIPDWHWAYDDLVVYDHTDVEKAKDLLAQAGYPEGFEVTIHACPEFPSEATMCEMTAAWLQEIGIDATIETHEWGIYVDNFVAGNYAMWCDGIIHSGDPDDAYYSSFHSNGVSNLWSYSNPEVDRLLDEARATSDPSVRKELYAQVDAILLEEVPCAFGILHNMKEAYWDYVEGYHHLGNNWWTGLMEIWMDQ
jgi:peptide/nickel transport system substrate-binding protein